MSRGLTFAASVALCLGLLIARPASQSRSADTHGRDAKPDYDRVFAQDSVKRLDIRVTSADWSRLTADMTEMSGPFGSARTGGRGGGFNMPPDPLATAACAGLVEGSVCSFGAPPQSGRCTLLPMGTGLTCTALPGGGGKGVDLANVSVLLGHSSIKVTERHYSPWVKARQEQLEADVRRTWPPSQLRT